MQKNRKLPHLSDEKPVKILFVCLGNICRSPAAEGVMQATVERHDDEQNWVIDSAGTGRWHVGDLPDRRMRKAASARGLNLSHICRQVRESDFDEFDIIVGMDSANIRDLRRLAPSIEDARKIVAMADFLSPSTGYDFIPDPYYEGAEGFELVLNLLEEACENLYAAVRKQS